jgi:trimeric autotransporter adhesin
MKTSILLLLTLFALASCKKEAAVTPGPAPLKYANVASIKEDTLPDMAALKLKMVMVNDTNNYDETMFLFQKSASLTYNPDADAQYFAGFGRESLASISSDGIYLAINRLPYTRGMAIGLEANATSDNAFYFQVSYKNKIPANFQVWLKDTYTNDSTNVCTAGKYNFKVLKADTNSFGSKRFKLVLKNNN